MATEKQRRRRAKEKRHAYDLVEIDEEGNETVISASDVRPNEPSKSKPKPRNKPAPRSLRGTIQPPSWPRVAKRGLLIAPVFFVLVLLLGGDNVTIVSAAINAIFLLLIFVPFSYFLDSFVWRRHMKSQSSAKR